MNRRDFIKIMVFTGIASSIPGTASLKYMNIVQDSDRRLFDEKIEEYKDTMQGNLVSTIAQMKLAHDYRKKSPEQKQEAIDTLLKQKDFIVKGLEAYAQSMTGKTHDVLCDGLYRQGVASDMYLFQPFFEAIKLDKGNIPYSDFRAEVYEAGAWSIAKDMANGIGNLKYLEANIHTLNYVMHGREHMARLDYINSSDDKAYDFLFIYSLDEAIGQYISDRFVMDNVIDCRLLKWHMSETRRRIPYAMKDSTMKEVYRKIAFSCTESAL